jgi:hypothetical protein
VDKSHARVAFKDINLPHDLRRGPFVVVTNKSNVLSPSGPKARILRCVGSPIRFDTQDSYSRIVEVPCHHAGRVIRRSIIDHQQLERDIPFLLENAPDCRTDPSGAIVGRENYRDQGLPVTGE